MVKDKVFGTLISSISFSLLLLSMILFFSPSFFDNWFRLLRKLKHSLSSTALSILIVWQWHLSPVLLPGKSHGWRSFHFSLSCIGEGNGNQLQCSCLENPRDGGAWWGAVCGVTRSRTRLKWLSSSIHVSPPSWPPPPPLSPLYPSGLSRNTGFGYPALCIEPGLAICFTYGNIHISVLFSQIIPLLPSPTESKNLFFIPVSPVNHL